MLQFLKKPQEIIVDTILFIYAKRSKILSTPAPVLQKFGTEANITNEAYLVLSLIIRVGRLLSK